MENGQQVESTTALYKPCLQDNDGGCVDVTNSSDSLNRDSLRGVEFMNVDQCQKIPEMDDFQLLGNADVAVRRDAASTAQTPLKNGVKLIEQSPGKRRRGRPPRNQLRTTSSSAPRPPPQRNKKDEEDVCFICFDGGSLVLCDRRGCPKAYHPACIKRDEAFFKSKAKWNCGWHICSTCQKASYYMCYTCTYSLCKNCTKDADYVNVRGNKGFCGTCMRTVMLIENSASGNKEMVQVDFDDKTSWEYLFKVYWIFLKEKLSLSLDELTKAKNPWKETAILGPRGEASGELHNGINAKGANTEMPCQDLGATNSKRRKTMKQQKFLNKVESRYGEKAGVINAAATQLAFDGNNDSQPIMANDKRRKTRKKVDEKGQKANPQAFAAIDVYNMNMMYLRRNLMENLVDDVEKFNDKVVGSFVRIRIPGSDQKQDMHRLVQVVGTIKAAEPYKIGERTINVMLEILNLDKKEVVSIDGISNQEFSEDECQLLRQRIKCGLFKWFTVGEIQKKAMALQAVRVNDWLESEILRVQNLRDRASEKGHIKEFRECVEKLQLLNSPDERQRRLSEIPEVHSDPNMNQYVKSQEVAGELNEKKKEKKMKPRSSGCGMKEKEPVSPLKGGDIPSNIGSRENGIPPHSTGLEPSVNNVDADKWHYEDPQGKIQGPFPMALLRKWSKNGHFPAELRIWRVKEKQDDSILLLDALAGWYSKEQKLFHNSCLLTEGVRIFSDDGSKNNGDGDIRKMGAINVKEMDGKKVKGSSDSMQNDTSVHLRVNNESVKSQDLASQSSPCPASVDDVNSNAVQTASPLPHWDSVKGDPVQPQASSSVVPPSTLSEKPGETESNQVSEGHGDERWDGSSIHMNENMNKTSECQILSGNVKQDDSEGKSGKSCGQSWRSPPLNDSSNGWDSNSGLISLAKALEASEHNQDITFSDLPTSTAKVSHEDSKAQTTENKRSLSPSVPHQDSVPSWSTASSLVGNGPQLREVAGEWGGYSSTAVKPSVEEWDPDLVPESSLKPTELASDLATTPTSGSGQLTHSSPTDPGNNASGWDPIVPEPNEYSLDDESVSNLLAEVEAMESLNGLASPTSILRCDGELAQGSDPDCFSPVGGLSPAPDPGKSDALSSTNDLRMPSRSTVTNEPFGVSRSEVLDAQKSSGGHSSTSAEMDEDTRPNDASVSQYEAGSDMQPAAPPVTTWGMATADTAWSAEPETAGTNWGAVQENANFNWGSLGQGNTTVSWGTGQGTFQENGSYNSGTSVGNPPYWGNHHTHRYVGPRDRDFQDRDSSFGRGRASWNRQSSYSGVSSFRPPAKGQRVCKFYENGYCKKGASCSYWHP